MFRIDSPVGIVEKKSVAGAFLHVKSPETARDRKQKRKKQPPSGRQMEPGRGGRQLRDSRAVPVEPPGKEENCRKQHNRRRVDGKQQQRSRADERKPLFRAAMQPGCSPAAERQKDQQKNRRSNGQDRARCRDRPMVESPVNRVVDAETPEEVTDCNSGGGSLRQEKHDDSSFSEPAQARVSHGAVPFDQLIPRRK